MDSVIIRGFKELLSSMAFALALLLITGTFSVTQAAVTRIGTWAQSINNDTTSPYTGTVTAGASASGLRALVVTVGLDYTTQPGSNPVITVNYGGQLMTQAALSCAGTGSRCAGVFYLLEGGINAAGNTTLTLTTSVSTGTPNFIAYAATFDNVSQTQPIADFALSNRSTAGTTLTFGKNVAVGIGDMALYALDVDVAASTHTPPANYTNQLSDTTTGHSAFVAQRTVPVADTMENLTVSFTSSIASLAVAVLNENRVNTLTSCSGCHGYPAPLVDGGSRDPATGTFVGDHAKHNYDCSTCHGTLPGAYGHRDGNINISSGAIGLNNGTYTNGATVPQSNAPSPGSCDNVNCHGNNNTGTWGGAGYASCATSTCHGFPPATNAHTQHYTAKGWTTGSYANCVACHPDDFAAHTDRSDGVVTLANLTKAGSGTTITCSSISATGCHNGAATTPTWGSTGITCSNCHTVDGANSATVANPVSGLHSNTVASVQDHDNTLAGGCVACHVKASITGHWDGVASATADYTKAAVGITSAMYTDASGTGATRGSCMSNTALATCHSDNGEWRRLWSTNADVDITVSKLPGQAVCNVCHGQYSTLANSTGWNEGTGHYRSGSGASEDKGIIHADAGDECDDCHAYDSAAVHNSNNKIDFSGGGTAFTLAWGNNATNPGWYCNSGSCHAQTGDDASLTSTHTFFDSLAFPSPTRATPENIAYVTGASTPQGSCFGCHGDGVAKYWPNTTGADDGATTANQAGAHELHMAWLANKVYGQTVTSLLGDVATDTKQRALCQYCHDIADGDHMSATVADVFRSAPKRFQDGVAEIAPLGTFETTGNTCSNVDCHAQYGTAAAGSEPVATPNWYIIPTHTVLPGSAPTTMNCAACHINPTTDIKHTDHTGANTTFGVNITCARCHSNGPVWGSPTGTLPSANHLNGTFEIAGTATLTYAGNFRTSFGSCGTNVCHNNGTSTTTGTPNTAYAWGDSITNCAECHLGVMTSNAHNEHSTASGYASAPCTECHALETATTHIDGNINFNIAKATYSSATAGVVTGLRANASQTGTCLTSGCHNKAAVQSAAWNTTGLLACNACHGNATAGLSAAHADHITAGKTCSQCHADPITDATHISFKTTLSDGANAATGEASVPFSNAAAVVKYTYNNTEHSCYSPTGTTPVGLGCHATAGSAGAGDATRPDWDTTIAVSACTACHTNTTTTGVNPTSGLHQAGTLTSSTPHNTSLTVCTTCHTAVPALGGAHINGVFTINEATATNEYYTLATMYTDAAANSGTCSGVTAGAAGCHDSIFDAGSWARKWSATAYNIDGTQCANCHGGFNNDWTFGSADNSIDLAVSHTKDWNSDGLSNELVGKHLNNTGNTTKCNICHVYADSPYSLTWGTTGTHGNDKIAMNTMGGANTYSATTWTCTNTCHTEGGSHAMEASASSGTRVENIAGPALTCASCHSGYTTHIDADGAGATYTSGNCTDCHAKHADATAAGPNVIYVPTVYGANIPIPTMNASYSSHGYKIRLGGNATIGACNTKSTEAEWCWACHDAQATRITEWRTNNKAKTGNKAYDYGDLYTDTTTSAGTINSNWTTGYWRSGKGLSASTLTTNPYWYKRGKIRSTHSANYDAAAATPAAAEGTNWKAGLVATTVTATFSTAYNWGETLDAVANIRCTYCHDVHGTHNNGTTDVVGTPDAPYLRGTWTGNPYNEDGAPRYGMANYTPQTGGSTLWNYAYVPRASANPANTGITGLGVGGYWIDQNSGNPNGTLPADSAATRLAKADASSGLCEMCHGANKNGIWTQAAIGGLDLKTGEGLWVSGLNGHANSVIGAPGAASTAANIFNRTKRNGSAGPVVLNDQVNQVAVDMGLQNMTSGYGLSYRSASGAGSGYGWIPRVGQTTETGVTGGRAYAYEYFAWNTTLNANTGRTSTYATNTMSLDVSNPTPLATETAHNSQVNYHTFTCSKCHNPHASRLPKLMITNCLDTNHNTWEDKSTFTGTALTGVWAGLRHSQWASAQNCHRLDARATNATSVTTLGTGWTKVTPWQEDTTPNGTLTGDITTQTAY